jgi:hypothetical protein
MNVPKWISPLFWIAALYDGLLGVLFLAAPWWAFERFNVTPPNHMGYVQFPAALLIIFALIFAAIARDPVGQRGLIVYGILLKVAYCSITSYYWFATDIPVIWKPFVVIDLVMGILFVVAYMAVAPRPAARTA